SVLEGDNYEVKGGEARLSGNPAFGIVGLDAGSDSYDLEVKISAPGLLPTGSSVGGVVVRYKDVNNHFLFLWDNALGHLLLIHIDEGAGKTLDSRFAVPRPDNAIPLQLTIYVRPDRLLASLVPTSGPGGSVQVSANTSALRQYTWAGL